MESIDISGLCAEKRKGEEKRPQKRQVRREGKDQGGYKGRKLFAAAAKSSFRDR